MVTPFASLEEKERGWPSSAAGRRKRTATHCKKGGRGVKKKEYGHPVASLEGVEEDTPRKKREKRSNSLERMGAPSPLPKEREILCRKREEERREVMIKKEDGHPLSLKHLRRGWPPLCLSRRKERMVTFWFSPPKKRIGHLWKEKREAMGNKRVRMATSCLSGI